MLTGSSGSPQPDRDRHGLVSLVETRRSPDRALDSAGIAGVDARWDAGLVDSGGDGCIACF